MNKIGIVTNIYKDLDYSYTKKLIKYLIKKKCKIYSHVYIKEFIGNYNYINNIYKICSKIDFFIVLGGDGTVLKTIKKIYKLNLPIIGINLGTLGYLTDVEKSQGILAINKVLKGNFKIENRTLLDITTNKIENKVFIALNDAYILKDSFSKILKLSIRINSQYINTFKADGIIVSTPTGSTAYNLSAGGPILKYDADCIIITPICAHELFIRPLVLSNKDIISIKFNGSITNKCCLILDGHTKIFLKKNQVINIKKSKYFAKIIKTNNLGFYQILKEKFYNTK